ncbi:MAG: p-cumate 2,3-dioxygenase subunit beta [Rhodospirillaceae bacterium]|jgi:p-cumate 2,3-dioxygenase beta subunit|nr:p-cumate 2,3-dioxygenase subunit beta [Rhodospirillaceae bacterium]
MTNPLARSEAEDFLFKEAALLDAWRLEEWANLFTADGEYLIPATDAPDGAPGTSLYLVYDDRHRLGERAKRLLKKTAHAEQPRSRTRHMSSNVMVAEAEGAVMPVFCNFVVFRSRMEKTDIYPGHAEYRLMRGPDGLRIRSKKAILDIDVLRPQGKVSIIL